jgi:tyrosyl-tRNA synthetase
VTTLVHGAEDALRAESATAALFSKEPLNVTAGESIHVADRLLAIADDVPSTSMAASEFDGEGMSLVDVVARVIGVSKSEARRLVQQGGVSVNDRKVVDTTARLTRADALDGRVFLLGKGARQRFVIRIT